MNTKLYKKYDNLKDLLDGKYNERDNILKKGNIYNFNIIDNEVQNIENEIQELEKEINNNFEKNHDE